jgi:hypothetical protein
LFTKPTILELNDLNEQDKSLVMMFLLTLLREFRETNARRELQHVTVVEEAHNVLANVPSAASVEGGMSDIRAKAVQAFCNMLSEVRAYGEGLIISDQSPEKLARDAMRNTNVQIAHQLRDAHDREAIANAMIMDEEQRDYLGKVEVGRAAVFYTGLQKATFITVPLYVSEETDDPEVKVKWCGFNDCASPQESDEQVRKHMSALTGYRYWKPWRDCALCLDENEGCRFQKQILAALAPDSPCLKRFENALKRFADADNPAKGREIWMPLTGLITRALRIGSRAQIDAAWCFMLHLWGRYRSTPLTEDDRRAFEEAFPHVV